MRPQLLIACDFDGTVTRQDTLVEILDAFGSPSWRQVQEKVVSGTLSIREALETEMGSVRASLDELKERLSSRVEVEPSFTLFVKAMRLKGVPLILLSGGFDLCIEVVLGKTELWPLPYLANRLVPPHPHPLPLGERELNGTGWGVEFPYPSAACTACGHCKADPLRRWNEQGYQTIFVGNGVTDRCAAQAATLTFAKEELLRWCQTHGAACLPYRTFEDVEKELVRRQWL